jgi:hypothetical protein
MCEQIYHKYVYQDDMDFVKKSLFSMTKIIHKELHTIDMV